MVESEARREYKRQWNKAHAADRTRYNRESTRTVTIRFMLNNEDDVAMLAHLDSLDNRSSYIKGLILNDIRTIETCSQD